MLDREIYHSSKYQTFGRSRNIGTLLEFEKNIDGAYSLSLVDGDVGQPVLFIQQTSMTNCL